MATSNTLFGLDVGTRRIGIARAELDVRLAVPYKTLEVDDETIDQLVSLFEAENPTVVIVGYPRNQSGEATAQTEAVVSFAEKLKSAWTGAILFQDESLTSVLAEDRLRQRGKPYDKAAIDAEAAVILLQDYIEANYGH